MSTLSKFTDIMKSGGEIEDGTISQFVELLNMSDEKYDAVYPMFKAKLTEIFSSKQTQDRLLEQLRFNPIENIEDEKEAVEEFIKEIKDDNSLSQNKKNTLITILEESLLAIYKLYEVPRERIKVKIKKLNEDATIPFYAHKTDAGADICSVEDVVVPPGQTKIIKTGIAVAIPVGYEIQIRPRSGLSAKTFLRIANAVGTIDSDYRGEIGVIMTNIGGVSATINKGDKIAQMVIAPTPMIEWEETDTLDSTERGDGGFGSTDKKDVE